MLTTFDISGAIFFVSVLIDDIVIVGKVMYIDLATIMSIRVCLGGRSLLENNRLATLRDLSPKLLVFKG